MKNQPLFEEFNPVSTAQWKEKIIQDLKGADYDKKLVTHLDEDFDIQPFYQKEHLKSLSFLQSQPGRFPFVRGKDSTGNRWQVNQVIRIKNAKEANHEALKAVANGADVLTFVPDESFRPDKNSLELLLQKMNTEDIELHFRGDKPDEWIKILQRVLPSPEKTKGSIENDPLAYYTLHGSFKEEKSFSRMAENITAMSDLPAFQAVAVDGTIFHNAGGTLVSEMAFTLAMGSFYMQYLTENGFAADKVAGRMLFRLATGSDYFMEIAKFRAFRYLWAQILKAFGVPEEKATTAIHAESSYRNKTVYDPYINMLRTTTETMSAILGGADAITVLPFDTAFENPNEMARRVARNQQLILKKESYFDKVTDPAAGSYYIEDLTSHLIEKSWELFLKVDDQGGYLKAFNNGFVQEIIETESRKKDNDIARRKVSVLGINQFPNRIEHLDKTLDSAVFDMAATTRSDKKARPLQIYRAAAPFEKLRYATDLFAKTNPRPRVLLLALGEIAMRHARAQFAENFFGCAGYEIIDNIHFDSVKEGITAARKEKPEIVVLCSDDKTYENIALQVFEALKDETIVVLAGRPEPLTEKLKAAGMQHFIYTGCNVLETLQEFNKMLGIK